MVAATPRGQTGVDRVFYLVAGVVALLVVVPAVMGVAGFDIRNGSLVDGTDQHDDKEGIRILSAYGTEINDDRTSVGVVEVVVTASDGSNIDLSAASVSWDGPQQYQITPEGVDVGTGGFSIAGETELTGTADRATLRFDIGSDDLPETSQFGERLAPGDSLTVSVITDEGDRVTRDLVVPDPLPPGAGVSLF